jgi:hypothetical protein
VIIADDGTITFIDESEAIGYVLDHYPSFEDVAATGDKDYMIYWLRGEWDCATRHEQLALMSQNALQHKLAKVKKLAAGRLERLKAARLLDSQRTTTIAMLMGQLADQKAIAQGWIKSATEAEQKVAELTAWFGGLTPAEMEAKQLDWVAQINFWQNDAMKWSKQFGYERQEHESLQRLCSNIAQQYEEWVLYARNLQDHTKGLCYIVLLLVIVSGVLFFKSEHIWPFVGRG